MRILLLLSLFTFQSLVLFSCKAGDEKATIKGQLENYGNQKLALEQLTTGQVVPVDSATTEKDGEFKLNAKLGEKAFYRLRTSDNQYLILILDSTENAKVTADARRLADTYKVEGSKDSELLRELNNYLKQAVTKRDSIMQLYNSQLSVQGAQPDPSLETKYNKVINDVNEYLRTFIRNNNTSFAALAAIEQLQPEKELDTYRVLYEGLMKKYPNSQYVQGFANRYQQLTKLAEGSQSPEIVLNTPEGNPLTLSSLRGKIVLVDFWASWCRPCRAENPNVVRMYSKYKDKGFEILGVSLDNNRDAWLKAIETDKLTWKHVSDLRGWQSSVVPVFNITGIPYTVLVDREGKIVAKGLRGEELEKKVAELVK